MKKKGQLTIFIIVAIVIIGIVALFFVFRDKFGGENTTNLQGAAITNFVQECIDETLEKTVYDVAKNGGYSGYSYLSRETTESGIGYYLFDGKNHFPSKEIVENQMEEYFRVNFFLCTTHFSDFKDYGVEEGYLDVHITIEEDKVLLNAEYPLTIRQGKNSMMVEDFDSEISSRLNVMYDSVSSFMEQQKSVQGICLGCFELAVQNDIYIDMENFYDGSVVFNFTDKYEELNNKPIVWVFANKY
jgi:hypothetical protein